MNGLDYVLLGWNVQLNLARLNRSCESICRIKLIFNTFIFHPYIRHPIEKKTGVVV